jgi:hypothetical protein
MNCTNCGKELPEITQGQFCPFCGAALAPAENSQQSFQHDASTAAIAPALFPWENRDKLGFVTALSQTWTESVLRPTAFFKSMPRTGGIGAPMLYGLLVGTIGTLFSLFWEYQLFEKLGTMPNWPQDMPIQFSRNILVMFVPFIPILLILSMLFMSLVYHLCLLITGSAKNGWEVTFRVIAYSSGPSIFLFLPFCGGLIAAAWNWTLQIIGWTNAHESTTARVVVAALLPMLLCCGLVLWAVFMFASMFRNLPIPEVMLGQTVRALLW